LSIIKESNNPHPKVPQQSLLFLLGNNSKKNHSHIKVFKISNDFNAINTVINTAKHYEQHLKVVIIRSG
jgi:hypothetical protein